MARQYYKRINPDGSVIYGYGNFNSIRDKNYAARCSFNPITRREYRMISTAESVKPVNVHDWAYDNLWAWKN